MTDALQSLPSRYYTDPTFYQQEQDNIFYKSWQFVCHVTDLPDPGSLRTVDLAGESIAVVKDREGELRAFYNVCRHRAHHLLEGKGQCHLIVCPYHAWSYKLDGSLAAAPGTEEVPGFDRSSIRLSPVRVEIFCGLIFVNLDQEAIPLRDLYPGLEAEIIAAKPEIAKVRRVFEDQVPHAANWKVSVENYSECYHCPVVHKFIVGNLYSADDYRITVDDGLVRHNAPRLQERDAIHGDLHIWFLWPNTAISIIPFYKALSIRHFRPTGPRSCVYDYLWYADPALPLAAQEEIAEMGRTYHKTNGMEDQALVASVQKGLESRSYDQGTLVVTPQITAQSENAVAQFQKRYRAAIATR